MSAVKRRLTAVVCLGVAAFGLVFGGGASATPPVASGPPATADSIAVQIIGPGQAPIAVTQEATAPPSSSSPAGPFGYPDDNSIVSAGNVTASATASSHDGTASAVADVTDLSIFAGEITADEVRASVSSAGTIGDLTDTTVTNLVILGEPVETTTPGMRIPLGDWGYAVVLAETTKETAQPLRSWRGTATALVVHLDADHAGLTAGTEIRVAFGDAYARPPDGEVETSVPTVTIAPGVTEPHMPQVSATGAAVGAKAPAPPARKPKKRPGAPVLAPPYVTPELTAGGYVFPVYGPSGYGNTFGAARGDVSGGWHHGDDIFASLGAPILAVATGTVFSVGWNDVGGYRLWLRDGAGNEFYYAHLSAYTSLAVNGRHVKAGQVLGFVGNTGDAQGTPFHLHFEVHPVSMLFLGYDGAVDPTGYLDAWKRLEDVRILPAVPFTTPAAAASNAPAPGAILLQTNDISTANGLEPGSLRRAMRAPATVDVTAPPVTQLPWPLPVLDRA